MKHITLKTMVAAAMLASNAGAIPIMYFYEGDFFTENQFQTQGGEIQIPPSEQPAGFTLQDRITGFLNMDTDLWGAGEQTGLGIHGDFGSGPFFAFDTIRITLSALGVVEDWHIFGSIPGLDLAVGGSADGSGSDVIFGDRWSQGDIHGGAFVNYPAGSPSRWSFTTPQSVPDGGATLLLLLLGITPLLLGAAIILVKPNQITK